MNPCETVAALLEFQQTQHQFAAHIRDPEQRFEGIEARRMKIYEDLFFKNIETFASGAFPVFRSLFDEPTWLQLVREFLIVHRAKTPYFLEISQEFMAFVSSYQGELPLPAFTAELCHYEWVELALDVAEESPEWPAIDANGDLLAAPIVLSEVAWPLAYQFPVHQISVDFQPQQPSEQPNFLLVYRDRSFKVRFMDINAVTYHLLQHIQTEPDHTGEAHLLAVGAAIGFQDTPALLQFGRDLLEKLQADGIVLGAKRG